MNNFSYVTAGTPSTAADLCGREGRYLAGGLDLLGEMKEYIASPDRLVNVKQLPGLETIEKKEGGGFRIGANVSIAAVASHQEFCELVPVITEAAAEIGSPQIRARATVGGNLAQHSRCWYYRQRDVMCLKRGGNTCYAREGENKFSSIFSGNPCVSPVVSNLAVALSVLDAKTVVWRKNEEVRMTMAELYADAWNNPLSQNSLRPGDLILAVEIPPVNGRSAYLQVSEKSDFDWALVSCAAAGTIVDGKFSKVRVALGAVAPVPYVMDEAEAGIEGKTFGDEAAGAMADTILSQARPLAHNAYKIAISRALIRRCLMKLQV